MNTHPDLLACPFCNAQLPIPAGPGQVVCQRCGEKLPSRGAVPGNELATVGNEPLAASLPQLPAPASQSSANQNLHWKLAFLGVGSFLAGLALKLAWPESSTTQRAFPFVVLAAGITVAAAIWVWFLSKPRTNRAIAGLVLGTMATVAAIAVPFALATMTFRRGNDARSPRADPKAVDSGVKPTAPTELLGLGYLPIDCNFVAGIHLGEIMAAPGGRDLFAGHREAKNSPPPWLIDFGIGRFEKLTGITAQAIDHFVMAFRLEGGFPSVMLVVRTLQPYDLQAVARVQAPVAPLKHHGRDLFQFANPPGMLFCADPQVLVVFIGVPIDQDKHLLTTSPRTGADGPPQPVREIMRRRLDYGTTLWWAAADVDQLGIAGALLPFGQDDQALAKLIRTCKGLTLGVKLQEASSINGAVQGPDAASAGELAAVLEKQKIAGLGSPKVTYPTSEGDNWVSFSLGGTREEIITLLRSVRFRW